MVRRKEETYRLPVLPAKQNADKLHKTKGIVLRTVKYGETSIIVTIFTELFGVQSYLVNGVRTSTKKGTGKASLFQPSAILDLVVYHNELKHLNRIKEFKWAVIYTSIFYRMCQKCSGIVYGRIADQMFETTGRQSGTFSFCRRCFYEIR